MRRLGGLGRDQRGAAMVEFALVLPFMLMLMFAGFETLQLVETNRRVAHVAAAVGDLVAQDDQVSDAELGNIFTVGQLLMSPLPTAPLAQRVASFTADKYGKVTNDWVSTSGNYVGSQPLSVPAGGLSANQSVIVTDVSYTYTAPLTWLMPNGLVFQKRTYLRPRLVPQIPKA